jgi:hypothetical protein
MTTSQPFERRYDIVSASKNLCVTTTLRALEQLTFRRRTGQTDSASAEAWDSRR